MNKNELLALCIRLGISANADMTKDQLQGLVDAYTPLTSATPVASATKGKSVITSFRYFDKMCFATLKNGVSGIVGDTTACSLRDMIALKGSGIQVAYEANGTWTDRDNKTHPKYRLEWSLE